MSQPSVKGAERWYVKGAAGSFGPFPLAQMLHYVILRRIGKQDLVSRDGKSWLPLERVGALDPKTALGLEGILTPDERQRLEREQQWLLKNPQALGERIHHEEPNPKQEAQRQRQRNLITAAAVALFVVVIIAMSVLLVQLRIDIPEPECDAVAAPGINWSGCDKHQAELAERDLAGSLMNHIDLTEANLAGAKLTDNQLAYAKLSKAILKEADLRGANLKGADLSYADLRDANLEGADLSYAKLRGALINRANIKGAILARTEWSNGMICRGDSIGGCFINPTAQ
ncbi:hypothetical protein D5085_08750 [Ectothiorhodospiraceae bacterium BW-2]|nr:hypothetical protein D5085_08750 [Ectothiorhodospiraceae bacterium BW-2]